VLIQYTLKRYNIMNLVATLALHEATERICRKEEMYRKRCTNDEGNHYDVMNV